MRPLYDRYRNIKRLLSKPQSVSVTAHSDTFDSVERVRCVQILVTLLFQGIQRYLNIVSVRCLFQPREKLQELQSVPEGETIEFATTPSTSKSTDRVGNLLLVLTHIQCTTHTYIMYSTTHTYIMYSTTHTHMYYSHIYNVLLTHICHV